MADISRCPTLTRASVQDAHERIKQFIHHTPVTTCRTLSDLASTPQSPNALIGTEYESDKPAKPKIDLFFKCENYQKIGAFKARGANHALSRLTDEELAKGVITHSSGASLSSHKLRPQKNKTKRGSIQETMRKRWRSQHAPAMSKPISSCRRYLRRQRSRQRKAMGRR
jgi:threonine dehydratase